MNPSKFRMMMVFLFLFLPLDSTEASKPRVIHEKTGECQKYLQVLQQDLSVDEEKYQEGLKAWASCSGRTYEEIPESGTGISVGYFPIKNSALFAEWPPMCPAKIERKEESYLVFKQLNTDQLVIKCLLHGSLQELDQKLGVRGFGIALLATCILSTFLIPAYLFFIPGRHLAVWNGQGLLCCIHMQVGFLFAVFSVFLLPLTIPLSPPIQRQMEQFILFFFFPVLLLYWFFSLYLFIQKHCRLSSMKIFLVLAPIVGITIGGMGLLFSMGFGGGLLFMVSVMEFFWFPKIVLSHN